MEQQSNYAERGSALISTLVAIGLLAIIIPSSIKSFASLGALRKKVELSQNELKVQEMVLAKLDCNAIPECTKDALIDLKGTDGDILVSSSGKTLIGRLSLRAVCLSKTKFELRRAVIQPSGTFAKDPLKQNVLDWSDPQGRLFGADELCAGKVGSKSKPFFELTGSVCETGFTVFGNGGKSIAPSTLHCSNGTKPELKSCPPGSTMLQAYWERTDDRGKNGNWVTRCMK